MKPARAVAASLLAGVLAFASPLLAQEQPLVAGADGVPVPKKTKAVKPAYPAEALAQGLRGIVILDLLIDAQGRVASTSVVRSVPGLDEAAIAAARQWEYEPTRVDGKPVSVRLTVPITFTLALPALARDSGVPELRQGVAPAFPQGTSDAGHVSAEVTLEGDGRVGTARVVEGNEPWAGALLAALQTWRFSPPPEDASISFRVEAQFAPARGSDPARVTLKATGLQAGDLTAAAAPAGASATAVPATAVPARSRAAARCQRRSRTGCCSGRAVDHRGSRAVGRAPEQSPPDRDTPEKEKTPPDKSSPSPASPPPGAPAAPGSVPDALQPPRTPAPDTPGGVTPGATPPAVGPPAGSPPVATPPTTTPNAPPPGRAGTTAPAAPTDPTAPPPVEVITAPPPPQPPENGVSAVRDVTLEPGVPDLTRGRRPVAPPLARMTGATGTVEVAFSVSAAGATLVQNVSGPDLLKKAAEQAVASWVFRRTRADRAYLTATFNYAVDKTAAVVRAAACAPPRAAPAAATTPRRSRRPRPARAGRRRQPPASAASAPGTPRSQQP